MSTVTIMSATWGPADVTQIVKDAIANGETGLWLENPTFGGDPEWLVCKILTITYSLDGGVTSKVVKATEATGTFQFSEFV